MNLNELAITRQFYQDVFAQFIAYKMVKSEAIAAGEDLVAAKNSAISMFHFRESLPAPYDDFDQMSNRCSDYCILGDVVNAFKLYVVNQKWTDACEKRRDGFTHFGRAEKYDFSVVSTLTTA